MRPLTFERNNLYSSRLRQATKVHVAIRSPSWPGPSCPARANFVLAANRPTECKLRGRLPESSTGAGPPADVEFRAVRSHWLLIFVKDRTIFGLGPANQLLSCLLGGRRAAILLRCETDSPMGRAHGGLYAEECDSY